VFKNLIRGIPMLKDAHIYRRFVMPFTLVVLLLFAFAPTAFAASSGSAQPNWPAGLKQHYLGLGDSLAYGFQPNCLTTPCTKGYVTDLFQILQTEGVKDVTNYGCPGETSSTFINGGCPFAPPNTPPQLTAAVAYLTANAGKVSPVTLDIGANDVLHDTDPSTCKVNRTQFNIDLATLDTNLKFILFQLKAALTINGHVKGDLVLMNYYDPLQNLCPNTVHFTQRLNEHLAADTKAFGFFIVNVFGAFGGPGVPNPNICTYTWMCTVGNIHPTDLGYSVIADTFAAALPKK
jgi:lysophospholipase L1-like esterase